MIFGEGIDQDVQIRQTAGLALKSQLETNFSNIDPQIIEYSKVMIMKAYDSEEQIISETAGNVISLILLRGGLNIWPGILDFLIEKLHSENNSIVFSAAKAVCFIIEDSGRAFEEPKFAEELDKLLPSLSGLLMAQPAKSEGVIATVIH